MAANDFGDVWDSIEAEARAEGPAAVADLAVKRMKYRLINLLVSQRRARHLTQEQLAERSGVAQAEISRVERGRKSPTLDTYSRLAVALQLDSEGFPSLPKGQGHQRSPKRAVGRAS